MTKYKIPTDDEIKQYMLSVITEHIDSMTDEINLTTLAEDASDHFNEFTSDYEIPEFYFYLAFDVKTELRGK